MNTEEATYRIGPYAKLAHLGCAGLILLAALSGSIALHMADFHLWLQEHPCTMPLLVLGSLAAAYLLEHALTTAAMLALLLISAVFAGPALASFVPPETNASLLWQLLAGPWGYFATVALTLHHWSARLYPWQENLIALAGALLLPGATCLLTGAYPVTTLCALGLGLLTATLELCVFRGRDYFEITSTSRPRSTIICMVMLITVPVYKVLWFSLIGCSRGGSVLFRIFRWW